MAIKYDKLLSLLEKNNITSYKLKKMSADAFMSQATLTAIKSGKGGLDHRSINKICAYFNCQPNDIMEYVPDEGADIE